MNEFFPLASAAGMTVGLAVCALIVGLALAMFFAVWESAKWRPVAWAGSALVTILRGLPEILVVLFIYFGSSQLLLTLSDGFTINLGFVQIPVQMDIENFDVSPFLCGVIALSLLYAAYASQTLRGALKAVPMGQWESGQALGDVYKRQIWCLLCHRDTTVNRASGNWCRNRSWPGMRELAPGAGQRALTTPLLALSWKTVVGRNHPE